MTFLWRGVQSTKIRGMQFKLQSQQKYILTSFLGNKLKLSSCITKLYKISTGNSQERYTVNRLIKINICLKKKNRLKSIETKYNMPF